VIAAEAKHPALSADQPGERVILLVPVDGADLDRPEAAPLGREDAVDEEQTGAFMLAV
jgi:hypothetical protein